jgi:hypothetical protein
MNDFCTQFSTFDSVVNDDFMVIAREDGERLVTIKLDGTVVIHHAGADLEAAKAFWNAVQVEGKTLLDRIVELERMVV